MSGWKHDEVELLRVYRYERVQYDTSYDVSTAKPRGNHIYIGNASFTVAI